MIACMFPSCSLHRLFLFYPWFYLSSAFVSFFLCSVASRTWTWLRLFNFLRPSVLAMYIHFLEFCRFTTLAIHFIPWAGHCNSTYRFTCSPTFFNFVFLSPTNCNWHHLRLFLTRDSHLLPQVFRACLVTEQQYGDRDAKEISHCSAKVGKKSNQNLVAVHFLR